MESDGKIIWEDKLTERFMEGAGVEDTKKARSGLVDSGSFITFVTV